MMKLQGLLAKLLSAVILLLTVAACPQALGQVQWNGPDLGNWNTDANWTGGLQPDAAFGEIAAINNNTTAILSAASDFDIGGLQLGAAAANVGGLRIQSGGSLNSIVASPGTGAAQIGIAGQGNLTILGGGSLTAASLTLGGVAGSSITLGDTSGLTATLTSNGTSNLNRTTNVIGPNVNFTSTGNLTLGATSILTGEIRNATNHGALKTNGNATLNGVFRPSFVGVVPGAGSAWTIVDATGTISGAFSSLDLSSAPALAPGLAYQIVVGAGGMGNRARLSVEEVLTLNVNRNTGAVSIQNIGATAKTIDGYSILSPLGALNPATWNSLDDQNVGGANVWVEAAPTANDLSELSPQGSSTINSAGTLALGSPYVQAFPALGTDPDQLTFEYTHTDGRIVQGSVNFQGTKVINDLILTVNPANGQVQLKNDSPYDVFIDGYNVTSASGSLVPGTWNSLQDQAVAGWQEAGNPNPSANAVAELRADGSLRLTAGSGFNLGALAKTSGTGLVQDLAFNFLQTGNNDTTAGTVVYGAPGAISAPAANGGVPGDFNNDNTVNAADYVVFRNAEGTNTILRNDPVGGTIGDAQHDIWAANFGRTFTGPGSGAVIGVPEPGSIVLLITALAAVIGSRSRRTS